MDGELMRRSALLLVLLAASRLSFGDSISSDQMLQSITNAVVATAGPATGTFTVVQKSSCSIASGATTCSLAVSPALAAGNAYKFACSVPNSSAPPRINIASVNVAGTLMPAIGASTGSNTGAAMFQSVAYILPSTSAGHASPIVITLGQAASSTGGNCYLAELHPSANGSSVGLDIDQTFQPSAACTSCVQITPTLSATGDEFIQAFSGATSYQAPSAIASPYNANFFAGSFSGFSEAITSAGNATWTTSSTIPILSMVGLGWNPTAGLEQSFNDFEGGTSGSAVTAALLGTSHHGWQGGSWALTGTIDYITTNMPLRNATGRLYGDGISYAAGAGSLGIEEIGSGSAAVNNATYSWRQNGSGSLSAGVWFCSDIANTDTTAVDVLLIGTDATDYANVTFAQTGTARYFTLETPAGNSASTIPYATGTGCGAGGTGWVFMQIQYKRSPATASLASFNTSGAQVGTTLTATTSGTSNPVKVVLGHLGSQAVTTGKHDFWDSLKIDLNATFPMTQ
jgi:hypothetical protein